MYETLEPRPGIEMPRIAGRLCVEKDSPAEENLELREKVRTADDKIGRLRIENRGLKQALDSETSKVSVLVRRLTSEVERLQVDNARLRQLVSVAEANTHFWRARVQELEPEIAQLRTEIIRLKAEVARLSDACQVG